jgi:hypothetical protein
MSSDSDEASAPSLATVELRKALQPRNVKLTSTSVLSCLVGRADSILEGCNSAAACKLLNLGDQTYEPDVGRLRH